ncbi:MAG: site-specific integrase [Planctomycetaceae bacterium]
MTKRRGRGEGSITHRPDKNCWQGVLTIGYDAQGRRKRRVVYGPTRKSVQDKLTRLQGQKLDGTLGDLCKLRLAEYLDQWLENCAKRTVRETTYVSYEVLVRLHIKPHLGGIKLTQLAPSHIDAFLRRLNEAGHSPRRQQMAFGILRGALNHAVKRGLLLRNVCQCVDTPKAEQREMHPLNQEEAQRFLKAAEGDRLHALYVLALTVGAREGELLGLEWKDVDLDMQVMFIRRTLNESLGKFLSGPPKTKRGTRKVRLPQVAIDALLEHRKRMLKEGHAGVDLVFCDQAGGPLRRQNVQRRSFIPLLAQADCPEIRFHDLRHTYATLALANGVPIRVISDTMGHSGSSVTIDTYAHVLPSQERLAADKMDAVFGRIG